MSELAVSQVRKLLRGSVSPHSSIRQIECRGCKKKRKPLQRKAIRSTPASVPSIVDEVLRSPGHPLASADRAFFEPRFSHDFSRVRVHIDARAAESARAVNALAYTVGRHVVFGSGQYAPQTSSGRRLMAHELTHVVQQTISAPASGRIKIAPDSTPQEQRADAAAHLAMTGASFGPVGRISGIMQRKAAPYIKKITVHLAPPQSSELEWEGTAPSDAPGSDHFTVSTGKGYGDPGDPPGTCRRNCCQDAMTQCAPPWNRPDRVGACCTYYGDSFWTGVPEDEHNGWKFWTPIQPYYSSRGIALHQHTEVTGDPIGHGCVRMDEPNAQRIHDFSNGRRTNVTIDGRAAPVACEPERRCTPPAATPSDGPRGALEAEDVDGQMAAGIEAIVPGLEGEMT